MREEEDRALLLVSFFGDSKTGRYVSRKYHGGEEIVHLGTHQAGLSLRRVRDELTDLCVGQMWVVLVVIRITRNIAEENLLLQIRPAFGGNIIATIINYERWPQMATVREGVMPMPEPDASRFILQLWGRSGSASLSTS